MKPRSLNARAERARVGAGLGAQPGSQQSRATSGSRRCPAAPGSPRPRRADGRVARQQRVEEAAAVLHASPSGRGPRAAPARCRRRCPRGPARPPAPRARSAARRRRAAGRVRSPRRRRGWRPARAGPRRASGRLDRDVSPSTCTRAPAGCTVPSTATVSARTVAPSCGTVTARRTCGSGPRGAASSPQRLERDGERQDEGG